MRIDAALDCSGGFKAEGAGVALMSRLQSDDPTAIIGLPLIWLSGALREAGFAVP
jgi:septum formation protein